MFADIREKYKDDILLGTYPESLDKRPTARLVLESKIRAVCMDMVATLGPQLIETCYTAMDTAYLHRQDLIRVVYNGQETIPGSIEEKLSFIENAAQHGYPHIIKIIGLEFYSPMMREVANRLRSLIPGDWVNVTIQGFWSAAGAGSYPMHLDADEVVLVMLEGSKIFHMGGENYHLLEDDVTHETIELTDVLYIPAYQGHKAQNLEDNLMLSIGFEYPSSDKLNYTD